MLLDADVMHFNTKISNKFLETVEKLKYIEKSATIKIKITTRK
jgi:hypothetical protein